MKKTVCMALSVLMLCGCTQNSTDTVPSASPTPTAVVTAVPTAEPAVSAEPKETITNPVEVETSIPDMSGYTFLEDDDPAFLKISFQDALRMFAEGGTGILYYGSTGCPWCQRAVPVLNEAAKEQGIKVYYVDTGVYDFTQEEFDRLLEYTEVLLVTDSEGEKSFQIPQVIALKDGEILGYHLALVDGFEIVNDSSNLNEEQSAELQAIYRQLILSAAD